nr:ribonuclease H-like domain-containing protein [Tanacetum cinerariifolium]
MAPIIEDWVSDSKDESKPNDPQSASSFVQTSEHGKLSGHSVLPIKASILETTHNSTSLKTKVPAVVITKSKPVSVTAARPVNVVVPKIMGVIDSGCSRHMIGNISYLYDFLELNGGYVAFGGNSKGGKITGKFKGKVDEGFLVGYSMNSKAFRVFNSQTRIVQETLHVNFLENKENIAGTGPTWLFDIDSLTRTMNYQPVTIGNQSNPNAVFQEEFDAGKIREEAIQQYMLFLVWSTGSTNPQNKEGDATFDGNEHSAEHPESTVNLSPSCSALSGEQDDITKKRDKGKSH